MGPKGRSRKQPTKHRVLEAYTIILSLQTQFVGPHLVSIGKVVGPKTVVLDAVVHLCCNSVPTFYICLIKISNLTHI